MSRPMMFSAAYSARFEEARRQSQEQERPRLLWRRGFHSEGGRAGWGYYLEPAPLEEPSTGEGAHENGEGAMEDVEDGDLDHKPHANGHEGHVGELKRSSPKLSGYPASWARVMASHGRRIARETARRAEMASKTYAFVSLWFALTIPVIFWDAGYCFLRPRSMVGGDLHWIWKPYAIYQEVDYVYGLMDYENGEGFTNAQSALNIVENFMNVAYLYLAHVSGSPVAPMIGFTSAVMTLSKTVLYWLQEYYCGGCKVGHNDLNTLILYWIIPNGFWLLVPSFIIYVLGRDITAALRVADRAAQKTKKQ